MSSPTVDPEVLPSLFAVVQRVGIDGPAVWRAAGLPPLDPHHRVPLAHDLAFRGALVAATGDPDVGVTLAGTSTLDDYGLIGATLRAAPSLRVGLLELARLMPLWQQGPRLGIEGDTAVWSPPVGFDPVGTDVDAVQTVFVLARLPELLHGAALAGVSVWTARPLRRRPDPWTRGLTLAVGPRWAVRFPAALLDRPHAASVAVRRALREAAERALGEAGAAARTAAVAAALGEAPHAATLSRVARALGRSARALQRDLDAEGTTFREVRDAESLRRACAALADPSVPIDALAERLGFATTPAFSRAFRRWTGTTPARWRRGR